VIGLFGEARVNVLALNLALDQKKISSATCQKFDVIRKCVNAALLSLSCFY
jgi:hypothetical protein